MARAVGKTVRAIHLYEELGLLKAHERSKGRYRLFTPDAVLASWTELLGGDDRYAPSKLAPVFDEIERLIEAGPTPDAIAGENNQIIVRGAKALGLPYLYLGYWIAESPKMAYKARFHPVEMLRGGRWERLTEHKSRR